ncbi:MAG: alpha-galactosidase [Clostridiales bacterium]|jgi:alpha-galactosidase|nr:alpha-galactosidase [Clostridiales bacterium]
MESKNYDFGGLTAVYTVVDGAVSLTVIPASRRRSLRAEKLDLSAVRRKFADAMPQSVFQIALRGDVYSRGLGMGMNNSSSCGAFCPTGQEYVAEEDGAAVVTRFDAGAGLKGVHTLRYKNGVDAFESFCEVYNGSESAVVIERLDSFSVSNLSPFEVENDSDSLVLHYMRSHWSGEGRLVSQTLTELSLEDSWSLYGARAFGIGQTGSMPANGYLPFMAVEDKANGLTYAVSVECPASWRIDARHSGGHLSLCGGGADYASGHFALQLNPGESYKTNSAFITAADGGLLAASGRLIDYYSTRIDAPAREQELPIIYNEYCYSWGAPSIEKLRPLMNAVAGYGVDYFVTDAGWYRDDKKEWYSVGDWNINGRLFPDGFNGLVREVESRGMSAGIWFEFESVSVDSEAYAALNDCLLRRDGHIIRAGQRAFLDFRKDKVREYLTKKVIKPLKEAGIGYIKVDYNETAGIGADGASSPGEGLRGHINCVLDFFGEIKRAVPGIVIEICSSGGMRLEPKFLSLAAQASFSDAHECPESAVIAGNLHRYMPPRQMQIWAALKKEYSLLKTGFVTGTAMLGRYCLSGDIPALSVEQKDLVRQSVEFYRLIRGVIRDGDTVFISQEGVTSYKRLRGSQTLLRAAKDGKTAVLYAFNFDGTSRRVEVPNLDLYAVSAAFGGGAAELDGSAVRYAPSAEKHGCKIFFLTKNAGAERVR